MLLGTRNQVDGDRRQFTIDYTAWLRHGETISSATVTVDTGTATVDTITYSPNKKKVSFCLNAGTIGTTYNVIVTATTSLTQIRSDSISFTVIAKTS